MQDGIWVFYISQNLFDFWAGAVSWILKVLDVRAGNEIDQELGHLIRIGLNNLEAEFREGIIADCEHIVGT